jgi:hypothetical protein
MTLLFPSQQKEGKRKLIKKSKPRSFRGKQKSNNGNQIKLNRMTQ